MMKLSNNSSNSDNNVKRKAAASRFGISVISLASRRTARLILSRIGHTSVERQNLRREIFVHISRNTTLQNQILAVLAKHPAMSHKVIMELARDITLRKKLLLVAGSNK